MRSTVASRLRRIVPSLLAISVLSGCAVGLHPAPLEPPHNVRTDAIAVDAEASGADGRVGWGRFSLFYIPVIPIYVTGGANEKVGEQVRKVFEHIGYDVETFHADSQVRAPQLQIVVNEFWFNNYTWSFPFVPTWGSIELRTDLVGANQTPEWTRTFRATGRSWNFMNGYSSAANQAMDIILRDMVGEFASKEIHAALMRAGDLQEGGGDDPR